VLRESSVRRLRRQHGRHDGRERTHALIRADCRERHQRAVKTMSSSASSSPEAPSAVLDRRIRGNHVLQAVLRSETPAHRLRLELPAHRQQVEQARISKPDDRAATRRRDLDEALACNS